MSQFVEQLRNQAKWYAQPGHNARDLMDSHLFEKAADEIEQLAAKLEAAEKSDAESIAMYRKARDERDALRIELNEIRYGVAVAHDTIKALRAKVEAAEAEALEQARLNGMGSEREAALMAKLEAAERERDEGNRRRLEAADHFAAQTALMKKKYDALRAEGYLSAQTAPSAPSEEAAAEMGANGGHVVEAERLAFEAWMRGHCWKLGAKWTGTEYRSAFEKGGMVDMHAMRTRELWAAWRDRAALAAAPEAKP